MRGNQPLMINDIHVSGLRGSMFGNKDFQITVFQWKCKYLGLEQLMDNQSIPVMTKQ